MKKIYVKVTIRKNVIMIIFLILPYLSVLRKLIVIGHFCR